MRAAPKTTLTSTCSGARHDFHCECAQDTLETAWKAELCVILHLKDEGRARAQLGAFLEDHSSDVSRILQRVKWIARLDRSEDTLALSYFGQALVRMVNVRWRAKDGRAGTSQVFNYTRNLPTILEAETRSCIRDDRRRGLLDGTAGVPGGSAQDRKTTHVRKSRQLFEIEYDRQPSDDELVAFHNERMRATRKDAARQSVLVTKDDLSVAHTVPLDEASMELDARQAASGGGDAGVVEWSDRIAVVLERCEQLDDERESVRTRRLKRQPIRSADVARVYFAHHGIGQYPTRGEIVEQLGITEPAARRELGTRLNDVLDVARELFADYRCPH